MNRDMAARVQVQINQAQIKISRLSFQVYVEIHVLSAPTRIYYSYKWYGSVLLYDHLFARAHQHSETHSKRVAYRHESEQQQNTIHHSRTSTINIILNCPLIKYNVIIPSHPFSSSQVSLYEPPLNQLCQDYLPLTFNTPLYQSQVPFSGFHLLNHARITYTNTIKCPASYPAFYNNCSIVARKSPCNLDMKLTTNSFFVSPCELNNCNGCNG